MWRLEDQRCIEQTMPAAGETKIDRSMNSQMLITQDTKKRTRNLDGVIWIEELEEQVPANGGSAHCGRPHEARSLL